MILFIITWLLIIKPGVSSSRFLYSVKVVKAIITLKSDLDSVAGDIMGDIIGNIVKTNIMLNWLASDLM